MLTHAQIRAELDAQPKNFSLSRALYCDPGVFQTDLEQVWYREWLFAVPACEQPKPGAYATMHVGAYPVVVIRG
ncbi:MAG: Rieske (2Fe-2S) protein, partial [Paracoccus sp. (in: a-proteobacteria)]|nr:Rieske (2Fe-2S) protein [Paracoccus sp. (in: a-proteobacteria)]